MPDGWARSLTWDQGEEMAGQARTASDLDGRPRRVLKWMTPLEESNRTGAITA
ncbi:MAG: hypothetical protein KTV68_16960 [Acidimicrobiia bacterium]|nr:hypothetical protein [Acidimicrobiia bacterium]